MYPELKKILTAIIAAAAAHTSALAVTPTPSPPESGFSFEGTDEGWQFFSMPDVFGVPSHALGTSSLDITTNSNTSNFGFWQSPELDYAINGDGEVPENLPVRVQFRIKSDLADATQVPQFRLRMVTDDSDRSHVMAIESNGDASLSPTMGNMITHSLFFPAPRNPAVGSQSRQGSWLARIMYELQFDLLNFNGHDSSNATISLDHVDSIGLPVSPSIELEADYDFESSLEGWTFNTVPGEVFDAPQFFHDIENNRLAMTASPREKFIFGWLGSPENQGEPVTIQPNRLYYAVFTVGTDQSDPSIVPIFRARINESGFRASQYAVIASTGPNPNVPTAGNPIEYKVYFPPNVAIGSELIFSLDLTTDTFRDNDAPNATIYLERLQVFSVPYPY